jgi:hypothetical protein
MRGEPGVPSGRAWRYQERVAGVPKSLIELWSLAEAVAHETGGEPRYVFDAVGLLLERQLSAWSYFCSPRNALTFASTGGDGVHFGLLQLSDSAPHPAPVVMTVPMSDTRNIVLAEDLEEFLGLGCRVGWFMLEQLAYDPDWTVQHFADSAAESSECEAILNRIRTSLRVRPVPLSLNRLAQLKDRYLPRVQVPDRA